MSSISGPATAREIIEMPVTGLKGRTERSAFERPRTGKTRTKKEIRLIPDVSGSYGEPASPDSKATKAQVFLDALPHIVRVIAKYDSKAKAEQSGGSSAKGGVLTFCGSYQGEYEGWDPKTSEFDDPRFLDDINEANIPEKIEQFRELFAMGAMTYMTPPLEAAKKAYDSEIGDDPETAIVDLIVTDGKVSDPGPFEDWLEENAGPDHVVVVVVLGYDDGAKRAYEHYQKIAKDNRYLTAVWLPGVIDGEEIGRDVELAAGLAA
jgi:hypothetical protein